MHKHMRMLIQLLAALTVWGGILILPPQRESASAVIVDEGFDPGGCTTAVIHGSATANGRPLLWKNRDVSQPDQEIVYFNDGPLSYVTIANAGDSTQAWGGVNSAGFAIEDANNWNTPDNVPGPDDDGRIIKLALRTCRLVDDFEAILDSTSDVGHTQPAIFGVIDSAGGAAMFETTAYGFVRYNATDSMDVYHGIRVRSNWSYAGSMSGRIGVYRHNRAKTLIENAYNGDTLDVKYICRTVARDLRAENTPSINPYPLPYEGQVGSLPRGWISTYGATCRRLTVSACVIEGVQPGENPLLATLWAFPMAVQYGVALPFWVASETTPPAVNGPTTGPLCDEGLRIKQLAQHREGFRDTLDTYILVDDHGGGVHAMTFPLEDRIFERTDSAMALWRAAGVPNPADMTTLSAELAAMAYDTISAWPGPGDLWIAPENVNDLTMYRIPTGIRLRWSPVTQDTIGVPITPAGYSVWRYRSGASGLVDSLGVTTATEYIVPLDTDSLRGVYYVKAVR